MDLVSKNPKPSAPQAAKLADRLEHGDYPQITVFLSQLKLAAHLPQQLQI